MNAELSAIDLHKFIIATKSWDLSSFKYFPRLRLKCLITNDSTPSWTMQKD